MLRSCTYIFSHDSIRSGSTMTGGASNYSANPTHPAHHGNQRSAAWPKCIFKPDGSLKRCFSHSSSCCKSFRDLIYTFALVRDAICIIANQESFLACDHNTITSYSVEYERTLTQSCVFPHNFGDQFWSQTCDYPLAMNIYRTDCSLSNPGLLYSNRQIHREPSSIFYSSRLFDSIIGIV